MENNEPRDGNLHQKRIDQQNYRQVVCRSKTNSVCWSISHNIHPAVGKRGEIEHLKAIIIDT
jgi:hypothetical protein